ncbi:MAG TPA: phosphoglucosamine mutase, partial [Clostridia bacterium]|nr:phosphoglucosamine mutase [Clostridia bacterium]
MARMFGTDGVRGVANRDLTFELAFNLGRAGAYVLTSKIRKPKILIGRDTRISGNMLEAAMIAGITSMGADVLLVGVLPTPAVAFLTRYYSADAGIMISASHNPVEYNGIKIFDSKGYKLPDAVEDKIEGIISNGYPMPYPTGIDIGRVIHAKNAHTDYMDFLKSTVDVKFDGLKIALDCANGAASDIAARVFLDLGAEVFPTYNTPDGTNINKNCGSTHPEVISRIAVELGVDAGLAFDGDSDRIIASDERGGIVDGDRIMTICALDMCKRGLLKKNTVVTTVMSNMGMDLALREADCRMVRTSVGDRYVLEKMISDGYNLGGEQSGHIIFLDHNTTGDGILSGLQLL